MAKVLSTSQYHVWTDALHARALATQANRAGDVVDSGTYVRWTIITAWICFEAVCEEALGVCGLGYAFKRKLDDSIEKHGIDPIDWSKSLWQQVEVVHQLRKDYIHFGLPQERLLASVDEADNAVSVLREAIKDVYEFVDKPGPTWVEDDSAKGLSLTSAVSVSGAGTTLKRGARTDDPNAVRQRGQMLY